MATIERISLQRNVAIVSDESIAVRPSRGQFLGPLIELGIAVGSALLIAMFINALPLALLMVLLLISLILGPIAVLGLVYMVIGSNFVMERKKESARWQQGFLGLGIGTVDFVPFSRIKRIEVATDYESELNSGELQDIAHFEIVMVKDNDKRLTIGTVAAARPLADLGAERANRLATYVAEMAGVDAVHAVLPELDTVEEPQVAAPQRRRRRRSRRMSPPAGEA